MSKMIELNLNPDERILRQFGVVALVGFGALAAMAFTESMLFSFGLGEARLRVAGILLSAGVVSLVLGVIAPKANRPLFVALSLLSFPIGFVLSYVIMGALYFGLFAPLAILFRLVGRDSMQRRYDRDAQSYWRSIPSAESKDRYFSQF